MPDWKWNPYQARGQGSGEDALFDPNQGSLEALAGGSWGGGEGAAPIPLGQVNSQGHFGTLYKMPDGTFTVNGKPVPIDESTARMWLAGRQQQMTQERQSKNFGNSLDKFGDSLGPWIVGLPLLAAGISGQLGGLFSGGGAGGWTSGYDLAMGNTAGLGEGAVAGVGLDQVAGAGLDTGGAAGGGAEWTSGYDLGMGNTAGLGEGSLKATSTLADLAKAAGGQGQSALAKILSGNASMQDMLALLGPAMSIGSGAYGLGQAADLKDVVSGDVTGALAKANDVKIDPAASAASDASKAAIAAADPWSASGGRALADQQLQALMKSPGSLMTDPGYAAKMMGVDRVMAAQGQLGGGGGAVAAANASGDYYSQRLKDLANLENMGNPVGAQQVGLGQQQLGLDTAKAQANLGVTQGQLGLDAAKLKLAAATGANTLAGQSLASIGYGVTQATGGNTAIPAQVLQWFKSQTGAV